VKTSVRFFVFAGAFGLVIGVIYWFLSYEQAGTVLLLLMGVAPLVIAGYLLVYAYRKLWAEDRPDASPEDAAGDELGHFSTGSLWPLIMAIGVVVGVEGFVYGRWFLIFGGLVFVAAMVGLMQESHG
jgi:hypothetical protein